MSITVLAHVVAGFKLSDVVEIRNVVEKVQRFHEVTGVPYEKENRRRGVFVLGKEVPELELEPYEWEKFLGMKVFTAGGLSERWDYGPGRNRTIYDLSKCAVGFEVLSLNDAKPLGYIDPIHGAAVKNVEALAALCRLVAKLEVPEPDLKPATLVVLYASS